MLRSLAFAICIFSLAITASAQSTGTKRGAAAAGRAISEWADRQAALDAEIELAKAKAEVEIDKQRRLRAIEREAAEQRPAGPSKNETTSPTNLEQEEAKLKERHPQWAFILRSSAYGSWLGTRSLAYQQVCRSTQLADVASSCIEDFFKTKILQAQ